MESIPDTVSEDDFIIVEDPADTGKLEISKLEQAIQKERSERKNIEMQSKVMKNVLKYKWKQEQDYREAVAHQQSEREEALKKLMCEQIKAKKKMQLLSELDTEGSVSSILKENEG